MNRKEATEYAGHLLRDRTRDLRSNLETGYLQLLADIAARKEGAFGAWKSGYYCAVQEFTGIPKPDDKAGLVVFNLESFAAIVDRWSSIGGTFGAWEGGYFYGVEEITDWKPEPGEDLLLSIFSPQVMIDYARQNGLLEIFSKKVTIKKFEKKIGDEHITINIPLDTLSPEYPREYRKAMDLLIADEDSYWLDEDDNGVEANRSNDNQYVSVRKTEHIAFVAIV